MDPVITTGSTGDKEFTANWKENSYTIQFIPYGDGTTGSMDDMNLKYTDRVSILSLIHISAGMIMRSLQVSL